MVDEPERSLGHDDGVTNQPDEPVPALTSEEGLTAPTGWMGRRWNDLKADFGRVPRWIVASLVLLSCVTGLLGSGFHVCKDETVSKGADITRTHTCNTPGVTDAGVVAVALLIVLLIAPDMSEVGVFGVSLKRRLVAAEGKASASEAKAERLETQLQVQNLRVDNLTQSVATANAQGIGQVIITTEQIKKVDSEMSRKVATFNWDELVEQTFAELQRSAEPRQDPALVPRIIQNWEIIAASLDLPPHGPGRGGIPRVAITAEQSEQFRFLFEEEIQIVRAARNTVAHAQPIADDALKAAVDISEQLLEILRRDPPPDLVGAEPVS